MPSPLYSSRNRGCRILRLLAALAGCTVLATAAARERLDPERDITLGNEKVRLLFEARTMGLAGLTDLATGLDHLAGTSAPHSLFELTFATGLLQRRVSNVQYKCTQAQLERLDDGTQRLLLEWNDVSWYKEARALNIRISVELPAHDGVALWRIAVDNRSDEWGLWSAAFPLVMGMPASGKYDIARPAFSRGGLLLPQWKEPVSGGYPSGGWSMQMAALTRGNSSVYLATYDPDGWRKDFEIDPSRARLQVTHYPEGMGVAGSSFPEPYPVAFGVQRGDWRDAALRYREWAMRQKWAAAGPLSRRSGWPRSLADVGYWMVYNFPLNDPETVAPGQLAETLESARSRLGVNIGLHWYRWHQNTFDNLYPNFFPARPDFTPIAAELVKRGFLVMPYINGVSVDRSLPDFARFRPGAVKDAAGGLDMNYYLETSGRLLAMCGHDRLWQQTVADLVRTLSEEHHINGVYVDQISAYQAYLCFDAHHGHPIGGGDTWTRGYRDLLRGVQNVAKRADRDVVITSEAPNEVFLDLLDANLTWGEATGFEIPMFEMVYSGYTVSFGSICSLTRSENFFRRTQGVAVLDGRQPGWLSPALFRPEHSAKVTWLHDALAFRKSALPWLLYGHMLRPLSPTAPVPAFEETTELEGIEQHVKLPGAEARVWQAEDGRIAVLFANFLAQPVKFNWRLSDGGTEQTETLPPLGFKLREIPRADR